MVFKFSPDGITLSCMDGAKCALVSLRLDADKFESYHVPAVVNCGVSLNHLQKCIKSASSSDTITIAQPLAQPNELHIDLANTANKTRTAFTLRLLAVDSDVITVPSMDFDWSTSLPSLFLQRLCRDMAQLGEFLTLEAKASLLKFEVRGDFATQTTEIVATSQSGSGIGGEDAPTPAPDLSIRETFPLKYLTLFCRASQLSTTVMINLREGYPLVLSYSVASLGILRFVLAPKLGE